jgi:diketogulonate reductase-like aldo/keto reductase
MSDTPRKKRLRVLSLNLERIPLIGFGTYAVKTPEIIYNALSVGYRHLDLAENYNNLTHVKKALSQALAPLTEGGLGIERKDIWITMKIPVQSIDNISAILDEVGTDYFDLLLYHYPFSMFDSKAQLRQSWKYMTILKQTQAVKRIGVSNFYASHLTKLFDVCQEFNLEKPFANEIQINPFVYCLEKDTLDLCFQNNIQLIAYSPLGFDAAPIVLQDTKMQSIAEEIGITTAQLSLAWLLSKRICVIPKSNNILRQKENFASKDAIYNVLHFSDDMDKTSEGKDPSAFLLYNAEKSKEDANRLRLLDWNDEV